MADTVPPAGGGACAMSWSWTLSGYLARHRVRLLLLSQFFDRYCRPVQSDGRKTCSQWHCHWHGAAAVAEFGAQTAPVRGAAGRRLLFRPIITQPGIDRGARSRRFCVESVSATTDGCGDHRHHHSCRVHAILVNSAPALFCPRSEIPSRSAVATRRFSQRPLAETGASDAPVGHPCPACSRPGRSTRGRDHFSLWRTRPLSRPDRGAVGNAECRLLDPEGCLGKRS